MDLEKPDEKLKTNLVGFDDFLDDLFGLNIKGLKTLSTCFKSPQGYYRAAWSPDWQDKFTPSFRLWFTIIAITFFFQFFWASPDSIYVEDMAQFAEETLARRKASGAVIPEGLTAKIYALKEVKWSLALTPLFSALFLVLLAIPYRAWGKTTPFVVRQRNIFITIIPSTAIAFIFIIAGEFVSMEKIKPLSLFIVLILPILLNFITAYRGAFPNKSIWRSLSLAIATQIAYFMGILFAALVAKIYVNLYFF